MIRQKFCWESKKNKPFKQYFICVSPNVFTLNSEDETVELKFGDVICGNAKERCPLLPKDNNWLLRYLPHLSILKNEDYDEIRNNAIQLLDCERCKAHTRKCVAEILKENPEAINDFPVKKSSIEKLMNE